MTDSQKPLDGQSEAARPCAFLDRDGVINVDTGYPHRIEDLIWVEGAKRAILRLNEAGFLVIVVTNQSGVGRGLFTLEQVDLFHKHLNRELQAVGAHIDDFFSCPFHPDAVIDAFRVTDHPDRKPNPGMILRAVAEHHIDLTRSFLIGDKASDMHAAQNAGIPGYLFKGGDLDVFLSEAFDEDVLPVRGSAAH
jgi:D-glycero-D-manno-heptose 1,7-bisphosphate phosphatase